MKEKTPKTKLRFFILILSIIALLASTFTIINLFLFDGIDNIIRYYVLGISLIINIAIILKTRKRFKPKRKKLKNALLISLIFLYIIINATAGGLIFIVNNTFNSMNYTVYSSSLVVLSTTDITDIDEVENITIAILNDPSSPEGYIIPHLIIDEHDLDGGNEIIEYYDFVSMIADLYTSEIDAVFVPSSYASMFPTIEMFEAIGDDTRVVISKEKRLRTDSNRGAARSLEEPFTILLMGTNETGEELGEGNGNTLIVITFNPRTLNATMLSFPRDAFVPIACWRDQRENKIAHASPHGIGCMIETIENYLDIPIDYYARLNMVGLVNLVDAVGGVEVYVQRQLCTDNSNREDWICINPGLQVLNGEEALVFARNRKDLPDGDFGRNVHQQEILMALLNDLRHEVSFTVITELLNTVSRSLTTNFTTQDLFSFYNLARDIMAVNTISEDLDIVNITPMFLEGHGQMIFDEAMRMMLWNYVPSTESRDVISHAKRVNLELEEAEIIKEFSFSINEPFEREVVGRGNFAPTVRNNTVTVPSFIGSTEANARTLANRHGLRVSFAGSGDIVTAQSIFSGNRIDSSTTIVLTLGNSGNQSTQNNQPQDNNQQQTTPPEQPVLPDPDIGIEDDPEPDDPITYP